MKRLLLVFSLASVLTSVIPFTFNTVNAASLIAWGDNSYGQCNVPAGNDFVKIACGGYHTVALKSDGSLAACGLNEDGQCDVPQSYDFSNIAAGGYHSLALTTDGSLTGWGDCYDLRWSEGKMLMLKIADAIYAYAVANPNGPLPTSIFGQYPPALGFYPGYLDRTYFTGQCFSMNVTDLDPLVYTITCVAANSIRVERPDSPQMVILDQNDIFTPIFGPPGTSAVPAGNNFIDIACGKWHSAAVKSDGSLIAWKDNSHYQLEVPEVNNFTGVSAGQWHSLAINNNGSLTAWGKGLNFAAEWSEGQDFMLKIADAIRAYADEDPYRTPPYNILGDGDGCLGFEPGDLTGKYFVDSDFAITMVSFLPLAYTVTAISSTLEPTCYTLNQLGCWNTCGSWDGFYIGSGQCIVPEGNDFIAVAGGGWHSLALKADGSLVGWGDNNYGQCDVPEGNDFVAIACGLNHNLALKSNGSIIAWGDNSKGQCNLPSGNNFVAIAAGDYHSLALFNPEPGDFNADLCVDLKDFAVLATAWQSSMDDENWNNVCNLADPNNIIDWQDLAVLAGHWLSGCD